MPSEQRDLVPEIPIPIRLYSVLSVTDLRIKRARNPWRTVRAMAWDPSDDDFKQFVKNFSEGMLQMLAGRKQSNERRAK